MHSISTLEAILSQRQDIVFVTWLILKGTNFTKIVLVLARIGPNQKFFFESKE